MVTILTQVINVVPDGLTQEVVFVSIVENKVIINLFARSECTMKEINEINQVTQTIKMVTVMDPLLQ